MTYETLIRECLEGLKTSLTNAIEDENYELACQLRDEISDLEQKDCIDYQFNCILGDLKV